METIKPHFFMDLDKINEKPCYFCGGLDSYRDRADTKDRKTKKEAEPLEPGDFYQLPVIQSRHLGPIKVFECSICHNLIFFRSSYMEESDVFG